MANARLFLALAAIMVLARPLSAADGETPIAQTEIRDAARRALPLVQKAAASYPNHRTCFSCHHQTLPMLAMVAARAKGLEIDETLLQSQADFTHDSFKEKVKSMREGRGVGGAAMTAGYALWALDLAGRSREEVSEAMVAYILKTQRPDGTWPLGGRRPPLEESQVTGGVLASIGMRKFAGPTQREEVEKAVGKVKTWIVDAPLKVQEDRNFLLWGLQQLGAEADAIDKARSAAIATQHDDGGWPAKDDLPSDAYATGQTLARLFDAGLPVTHAASQRGLRFLLKTQRDDGSWKVETRSRPIQTYFDNGDPHGKHQFISTPATCWAVVALASALDPGPAVTASPAPESAASLPRAPSRSPSDAPASARPRKRAGSLDPS
jgi:N-acyl-D-amino-acid deacylase